MNRLAKQKPFSRVPSPDAIRPLIQSNEQDAAWLRETLQFAELVHEGKRPDNGILFVFRHDADAATLEVGDSFQLSGRDGIAPAIILTLTPRLSATPYDVNRIEQAIAVGDQSTIWSIAADLDCTVAIAKRREAAQ